MQSDAFGIDFTPNNHPVELRVDDVPAARAELESRGVEFKSDIIDSGVCHCSRTPTATRWRCITATRRRADPMGVRRRLREIVKAIASATLPRPPKRRYDVTGDAISQAFGGKGGGRGRIREGGEDDER